MGAGQIDEACAKLEGSYRLEPKTGTLTNLAACHDMQGKSASAWAEFTEAAAQAAHAHRTSIEQLARGRATDLETKLSRLTLRLSHPDPNVAITIDGRRIINEAIGTPLPLDPGNHKVVATSGEAVWSGEVTIVEGPASAELVIPELQVPAKVTPAIEPLHVEPKIEKPSPAKSSGGTIRPMATYGALAVGVVGIGVGTVFGLETLSTKSDADALCHGSVCTQHGYDLQEDARSSATLSTIGFGVGLVAAGVGVYLLVTSPKAASPSTAAYVGPNRWGFAGQF
ncbi:hypothetical protein [Labilithrix luteola]|nr:hypothetical protein [Labilithrix luteola]